MTITKIKIVFARHVILSDIIGIAVSAKSPQIIGWSQSYIKISLQMSDVPKNFPPPPGIVLYHKLFKAFPNPVVEIIIYLSILPCIQPCYSITLPPPLELFI